MNIVFSLLFSLIALGSFGQSVNVLTYNIRLDFAGDGINQWTNRKSKVFGLIKKYDPDIFGVQEATPGQMVDLNNSLSLYQSIGVGRDDGQNKGEFSAIFFKKKKYELLDQNTFWLSETPEIPGSKSWDAAITRIATWGKLKNRKSGRTFLVLNTHFDHIGKEARKKSAELLLEKVSEIAGNLPLIIMGDFNCTREEPPYQIMINRSAVNLSDTAPSNPPGTYCGFEVNAMVCKPIDYIFYSSHWKAGKYKVITDNNGKFYPSDHLPVMAKFKGKN
jgi:endonuclease/exonuclease/phosphatase family metal-dependent hydrolase